MPFSERKAPYDKEIMDRKRSREDLMEAGWALYPIDTEFQPVEVDSMSHAGAELVVSRRATMEGIVVQFFEKDGHPIGG